MLLLSILAPKLLPPYRGVAKASLLEELVCSSIVLLHELEWILALHHRRSMITLVHLVLARCVIHQNSISEALRHGIRYIIWPTPEGEPNDKLLV